MNRMQPGLIMLCIALILHCQVFAVSLTVTSSADGGEGTFRSVLANASDGDEIVFSLPEDDNVITLSSTIEIAASTFITGISINGSNGGKGIILDGGSSVGILSIKAGNVVNLRSLTFRNASSTSYGSAGAIYSCGKLLTAENCAFYSNKTTYSGGGIGVFGTNDGTVALVLVRCTFFENSANGSGGGVCFGRPARICMCSFIGNVSGDAGGGIRSACNNHLIANCSIVNNKGFEGAGLSMYSGSWTGSDRICKNILAFNNTSPNYKYASYDIAQYYRIDGGKSFCNTFYNPGSSIGISYVTSGVSWDKALCAGLDYGIAIDSARVDGVVQKAPRPMQAGIAIGNGSYIWHNADWSVFGSSAARNAKVYYDKGSSGADICEDVDIFGHKIDAFPAIGSQFIAPTVQIDAKTAVPYSWLCDYYPALPLYADLGIVGINQFHTDYYNAATNNSCNVSLRTEEPLLKNWESYVAGLNPTNAADSLTAYIKMTNSVAEISWSPDLSTNEIVRKYTTWGKKTLLTGDDWVEVPTGHEADYNFFKVTVEMK